jgi:hypothetical protein
VRSAFEVDALEEPANEQVRIRGCSIFGAQTALERLGVRGCNGGKAFRADAPVRCDCPGTAGLGGWIESAHANRTGLPTYAAFGSPWQRIAVVGVPIGDVAFVRIYLSEDFIFLVVVPSHGETLSDFA